MKKLVVAIGALAAVLVLVLGLAAYLLFSDQQGGEEVGSKDKGEPNIRLPEDKITPPSNKTLRLTIPKMERIKDDEIPTGLGTDEALFHDYAGVHLKHTGWPWQKVANVYIAGHRLGYKNTDSNLAFWDLNKLEKGDKIYITDSEGRKYTYEVFRKFIVTPRTLSVLKPVEGKNIVTLQTCTLPDYVNRLLVRGELKNTSDG